MTSERSKFYVFTLSEQRRLLRLVEDLDAATKADDLEKVIRLCREGQVIVAAMRRRHARAA